MKKPTILILFLFCTYALFSQDRITGRAFATRSEVIAQHGMACTSQPLATQTAIDILKAGGSAIDAAIAADAVLGLTEPTGSGMGGICLLLFGMPKPKSYMDSMPAVAHLNH